MSTRTRSAPELVAIPTYKDIRAAVRAAIYSPDPMERCEAAADLTLWGLPVSPDAVVIAAERLLRQSA